MVRKPLRGNALFNIDARWLSAALILGVAGLFLLGALHDSFLNPFAVYTVPMADWSQAAVEWVTENFRPVFQAIKWPIKFVLDGVETFFVELPPVFVIFGMFVLAWRIGNLQIASFTAFAMTFVGVIEVWTDTMTTLALVTTALIFCVVIGIPIGILAARSDRFEAYLRPVLDIMQTCPAFVYLIPIVMLVGIGNVPGVAVTTIFALPPVIRLTNLGIRQVPETVVEAAYAFGSSPRQVLFQVQFPLAKRTIMAGVNQSLMMALSMVVVASMISVEGLGLLVLRGIGRLDMGLATVGGIGIVLLAMVLDRITQAIGQGTDRHRRW
jgi:glycine betaine/proline transport system permease protein